MWPSHYVSSHNILLPYFSAASRLGFQGLACCIQWQLRSMQVSETCSLEMTISCLFPDWQRKGSHPGSLDSNGATSQHLDVHLGEVLSDRQTCPLRYLDIAVCRSPKIRELMCMSQTPTAGWLWSQPKIVGSNSQGLLVIAHWENK